MRGIGSAGRKAAGGFVPDRSNDKRKPEDPIEKNSGIKNENACPDALRGRSTRGPVPPLTGNCGRLPQRWIYILAISGSPSPCTMQKNSQP